MTAPNAELAYKVLDHIDANPDSWRQMYWLRRTECGTAACFAGWTSLLSGDKPAWLSEGSLTGNFVSTDGGDEYVPRRAVQLLGFADEDEMNRAAYGALAASAGAAIDADDFTLAEPFELFDGGNTREDLGRIVEALFGPRPGGDR
jgi:hypothetical protein